MILTHTAQNWSNNCPLISCTVWGVVTVHYNDVDTYTLSTISNVVCTYNLSSQNNMSQADILSRHLQLTGHFSLA